MMLHRNISCARKHLYFAQKCFHPVKYILVVPRNIYMSAQIFICLRGYSWASTQIFWFAQKYFGLCGNILTCVEIFSLSTEMYSLPAENYLLCGNIFKLRTNKKFVC